MSVYLMTSSNLLFLSNLFKRLASLTEQYAGLQDGRVHAIQNKIPRNTIKTKVTFKST